MINALLETDNFKNIEIYNHEINISIKRCGFETKLIVAFSFCIIVAHNINSCKYDILKIEG